LGEVVAEAEAAARAAPIEATLIDFGRDVEGIDTGRELPIKEARLRETDVELRSAAGHHEGNAGFLPATEEVALAQLDLPQGPGAGREAGAEAQLAGGLLLDLDLHDRPVRCGALFL